MCPPPTFPNLDRRLLFPLALSSPIYTLRDLYSLFVGFQWSTAQMFSELMAYDARRLGARLEVPFFLFQGESDVITLTTLAQEYFEEVEAPAKRLALIPDAGHFAAFTQPDRFLAELLARVCPLASPGQTRIHTRALTLLAAARPQAGPWPPPGECSAATTPAT